MAAIAALYRSSTLRLRRQPDLQYPGQLQPQSRPTGGEGRTLLRCQSSSVIPDIKNGITDWKVTRGKGIIPDLSEKACDINHLSRQILLPSLDMGADRGVSGLSRYGRTGIAEGETIRRSPTRERRRPPVSPW